MTQSQAKVGMKPLPVHDDGLCECYTKGLRKSRRQRLMLIGYDAKEFNINEMWKVAVNMAELQKQDDILKPMFTRVKRKTANLPSDLTAVSGTAASGG